jgi:hypothetical protein
MGLEVNADQDQRSSIETVDALSTCKKQNALRSQR